MGERKRILGINYLFSLSLSFKLFVCLFIYLETERA